jgi:hypothetical protein
VGQYVFQAFLQVERCVLNALLEKCAIQVIECVFAVGFPDQTKLFK